MKIIKSVELTEEENNLIEEVLNLLDNYGEADIDCKYKQEQELAYKAHEALMDFWLIIE